MKNNGKKGFSLVELAIVLVIIGLIVGGILTGQDLIHASELNAIQSDVNRYSVAVNTFRLKYNGLPGDLVNAQSYWGAETCPGSGATADVAGTCNGNNNAIFDGNEPYRAWEHLRLAGLISGGYSGRVGASPNFIVAGENMPATQLNGMVIPGYMSSANAALYTYNKMGNYFQFISTGSTPFLTPADTASIDGKYDDGLPAFGKISTPNNTVAPGCASSNTASAAVYQVSSSSLGCYFVVWLN